MSKSRGRVLSPLELADKYGLDALRYFLLREMAFGLDANFSEEALVGRLNADLANNLGNLLQRTLGMVGRYLEGRIPPAGEATTDGDRELQRAADALSGRVAAAMEGFAFHKALEVIWEFLDTANRYIDGQKPWELAKRDAHALSGVLGFSCEALRLVGLHLYPFMPPTAEKIWARLGIADSLAEARLSVAGRWGAMRLETARQGEALFPRVETGAPAAPAQADAAKTETAPAAGDAIGIEEFLRLDLRVAEILAAQAVPRSKKLVELRLRVGAEERTIVAGILLDYPPAELVGKQIVIVANLKPSKLMGVESRGMLLAAAGADGRLVLVTPERPAEVGSKVK
jgi:methionyl-tRNA synthetase